MTIVRVNDTLDLMKQVEHLEALVVAFSEIADEDWQRVVRAAEHEFQERAAAFDSPAISEIEVSSRNIGRGADWTVLALSFAIAAWTVPEVHRKIRENIEEWRRIYQELEKLFTWIARGKPVLYPDQYLFLKALQALPSGTPEDGLEYKGVARLPQLNPDLHGREDLLFSFGDGQRIVQVAVSRSGNVLWHNIIELS